MRKSLLAIAVAASVAVPAASADAAVTSVFGGAVPCTVDATTQQRQCSGTASTVPSPVDGVPIDVSVTLPPEPAGGAADGGFPLVMVFHGYGGSKLTPSSGTVQRWVTRGFAVFSMTTRGFNASCGTAASRSANPTACAKGHVRLIDARYEARDAQEFAGLLADDGLVDPQRIGAQGGSYGGGMSMTLGVLKDRKMLVDDTLVPWTSPAGKPMRIAAAAPEIPWTDLEQSLTPNGTTLDYLAENPLRGPVGVVKWYETALYAGPLAGQNPTGFYSPAGTDPDADLNGWHARFVAGEPFQNDPVLADMRDEMRDHHSSYFLDDSVAPAPMIISNGWNDDLFPVDEALRFYNKTRTKYPTTPIAVLASNAAAHGRGGSNDTASNTADGAALVARENEWFDRYVKGDTSVSAPSQVYARTHTCDATNAPSVALSAPNWAEIAPGEVRQSFTETRTVVAGAAVPNSATFGTFGSTTFFTNVAACASGTDTGDLAGLATYRTAVAPTGGYTLLGSATIVADIVNPGASSQLVARLFDVDGGGTQRLVARGVFRPTVGGTPVREVFQLHPQGWTVLAGHTLKLELMPQDPNYVRPSSLQQNIQVSNLQLRLPVAQNPGAREGLVREPAPKVVPAGLKLARDYADLTGPEGPKGDAGDKGDAGTPGPKGDTGTTGAPGAAIVGPVGPIGPVGPRGATGPRGPRGLAGSLNVTVTSFRRSGRIVRVTLRNRNAFTVAGTVKLRLNGRTLRTASYRAAAGKSRTVRIVLTSSQLSRLRRAGERAVKLRVEGSRSTGSAASATVSLKG